ncbi:MAG: AAA family ATPase [Rhodospirillales bacterium]
MTLLGGEEIQAGVRDWLLSGRPFGVGPGAVREIVTHGSRVFLGPGRVLKMKRAVRYPYLDFSTLEKRRAATEAEVALNRRTAPELYRGLVVVYVGTDGLTLDAADAGGEPVECLVDMARFPDGALLSDIAEADPNRLDRHLMEDLGDAVSVLHARAEVVTDPALGGAEGIRATLQGNAASFRAQPAGVFVAEKVDRLAGRLATELERHAALLDDRRSRGEIRLGHGDLHLANIFLDEAGQPVPFDCIDFDRRIASVDRVYDLAFLLMDLHHRGLGLAATCLFNRYFDRMDTDLGRDAGGLAALPLWLATRAAIRAHVTAQAALGSTKGDPLDPRIPAARALLDRALAFLEPAPPRLLAVGGLSGSGKSRVARHLAPALGAAPGARLVRTDVVRKRLYNCDLMARLGPEGYTAEATRRTFAQVEREIRAALAAGHSVVADAVFLRPEQRDRVETLARDMGVPFQGLWVETSLAIRTERALARIRNVSDATREVVEMQEEVDPGPVSWTRIDSTGTRENTLGLARKSLTWASTRT